MTRRALLGGVIVVSIGVGVLFSNPLPSLVMLVAAVVLMLREGRRAKTPCEWTTPTS